MVLMLIPLAYILSASSTSRVGVLHVREEVPAADPSQEPLPAPYRTWPRNHCYRRDKRGRGWASWGSRVRPWCVLPKINLS